jgi:hypothetical protein
LAIACLSHKPCDDAVKRDVVIEAVARKLLHALGMMRREIVPKLNHNPAFGRIENESVLRVEAGGERWRSIRCWCT